MNSIKSLADANGISTIEAEYIQTNKNGIVKSLFEELGLEAVYIDNGKKRYIVNTADLKPHMCFIHKGEL